MSELTGQPPECLDVSVTPDSVKSPTPPRVVSNAPGSAANSNQDRSGTSSPPPSCPICLGSYKNKCFTDSCLHQFCFNCLLEWSKIKAECPLCKQGFKSIIHNVKSEREFEEYLVQQPLHYNLMLSEPFRFSYSTTLQVRPSQNEAIQRLFLHHPSLTDRYVYSRNDTPNVRRRIYERGLYSLPLFDFTGRARECSAEFYRNNSAQIHRLIPFMNREAIHLIQDQRQVSSLLSRATEILTTHDITSAEFRGLMEPYFRHNTVHFIHEFYNFARSPYDMYGYDNNVQYSQDYNLAINTIEGLHGDNLDIRNRESARGGSSSNRGATGGSTMASASTSNWPPNAFSAGSNADIVLCSSSSSSSDDEDATARPSTSAAPSASSRRETVSVIQTNPSGGLSSGAAVPGSSSTGMPPIKMEQRVESVIRTAATGPVEPVKIELSDTDSDECQFVLERKPPHLRTPEYVSLNSDEDSDVLFVEESTAAPAALRHQSVLAKAASHDPATRSSSSFPPPQDHQYSSAAGPSNAALLDDIGPPFMSYMYGMDEEAAGGPSSSTPAAMDLRQKAFMGELKLKHEDPMLASASSSFRFLDPSGGGASSSRQQRRKRRSLEILRRQRTAPAPGNSSSSSSSSGEDEATVAYGVHKSAEVAAGADEEEEETGGGQQQRKGRSRKGQPYRADYVSEPSDSEASKSSSHDEFTIAPQSKMSARKKEAIKLALTKFQRRGNNSTSSSRKPAPVTTSSSSPPKKATQKLQRARSPKRKRRKRTESPAPGPSTAAATGVSNSRPATDDEIDVEEAEEEGRGEKLLPKATSTALLIETKTTPPIGKPPNANSDSSTTTTSSSSSASSSTTSEENGSSSEEIDVESVMTMRFNF